MLSLPEFSASPRKGISSGGIEQSRSWKYRGRGVHGRPAPRPWAHWPRPRALLRRQSPYPRRHQRQEPRRSDNSGHTGLGRPGFHARKAFVLMSGEECPGQEIAAASQIYADSVETLDDVAGRLCTSAASPTVTTVSMSTRGDAALPSANMVFKDSRSSRSAGGHRNPLWKKDIVTHFPAKGSATGCPTSAELGPILAEVSPMRLKSTNHVRLLL